MSALKAGWGFPTEAATKTHFFPHGELRSLCGKYGRIMHVDVVPDNGEAELDCKTCRAKLDKRDAAADPATVADSDEDAINVAIAWSDYRKDYGVSEDEAERRREHKAFKAGWKAGRFGSQDGVLR